MCRWSFLFALLFWRELKSLGERQSYSVYASSLIFFFLTCLYHFIASSKVISRILECRTRTVPLLWEYDTLIKSDLRHSPILKSELQQMQRKGQNEKCFFCLLKLKSEIELENELCSS